MPLTDNKIDEFLKKVVNLTDTPSENMSPADIKAWFDSSPEELRVKFNALLDDLDSETAASLLGAMDGATSSTIQEVLNKKASITMVETVESKIITAEQNILNKTERTGNHEGSWQGLTPQMIGAPEMNSARITLAEKKTSAFVNVMEYQNLVVKAVDSLGVEYDDWANAIQTAINENDRIEIPSGTFGISVPIKIRDYKIIHGNGRKTQLLAKVAMTCVLDIDNYSTSTSYTEIENIFVHGNEIAQIGIKIVGFTNNSKISNMWIERCVTDGIYLTKAWYSSLEKIAIRFCYNGIRVVSTGTNDTNQTSNVNCMNFDNMFIAFINNIGINFEEGCSYGNMISNSTIEACDNHGVYIKNIISPITCLNVYMETIKKNGYQVDAGKCLTIIGGYINVDSATSRCVQVGNINRLIIKGTSMAYWGGSLEYMVHSTAENNEISVVPLSAVTKRTIYYTGKFIGSMENVISGNGADIGYDMSSLRTRKVELTASTSYGVDTNIEVIKGSSTKASVDAGRIYQYSEKTNTNSGYGNQISLYGVVNDAPNTQKQVYGINNGFFIPYRLQLANYSTAARPTEYMTGSVVYDSTLKKPIVWNGTNWTDFMGTIV